MTTIFGVRNALVQISIRYILTYIVCQTQIIHLLHIIALFVFTTKEAAEKFASEDPYIEGGIVTKSTISEWTVAIGTN